MKKVVFLFALVLVALAGCSSSSSTSETLAVDDVVSAFQDTGLEAENVEEMTKDDYGMAPMKAEVGKRFFIPSLGDGAGGRIFSYENQEDLEEMKKYYDKLGEESAMFFSWTMKHENILIQINGDLPEEKYNEYKKVLESL